MKDQLEKHKQAIQDLQLILDHFNKQDQKALKEFPEIENLTSPLCHLWSYAQSVKHYIMGQQSFHAARILKLTQG